MSAEALLAAVSRPVASYLAVVQDYVRNFDPLTAPIVWDYPNLPFVVVPAYLAFVFIGRKVIKFEVPGLGRLLAAWNLLLSLFSLAMFVPWIIEVGSFAYRNGIYHSFCMPNGELWAKGSLSSLLCYLFLASKFVELFDTVFLVLRNRPVSLLHWYHHASVLYYCWLAYHAQLAFGLWFGIVNSFVHVIMYYYYFLAAISAPPKWGKYVTQIQMLQMVVGIAICVGWMYYHYQGMACPMRPGTDGRVIAGFTLFMYASYLALFAQLYYEKHYGKGKGKRDGKREAAGEGSSASKPKAE